MNIKNILGIVLFIAISFSSIAQKEAPKDWCLKDPYMDKIYGAGVEEAYVTLGDRKPKTVIVAVIDSGVEIDHEDLKGVIWVNEDEIPDNGIDDDNNGYIDDVNGWSFIGGPGGDIDGAATELARIYQRLAPRFLGKSDADIPLKEKEIFGRWLVVEQEYLNEMNDNYQEYQTMKILLDYIDKVEEKTKQVFSKTSNKAYTPEDELERNVKGIMPTILKDFDTTEDLKEELQDGVEHFGIMLTYGQLNADSLRIAIVGDNPNDVTERFYGCNRVEGPDAEHGTHVSGIIAANRTNELGIQGESNSVLIMPVRAVPNGDERDKDIANAIRYAVDNGASIINMSFGKYYTAHKEVVDEAVQYALEHDVLLIHAAGNDAKNSDEETSFPTRVLENGNIAPNWIEVGASSFKKGKNLPADFSNYGKKNVDLFGPGVDIYSTVTDGKYEFFSGTSMASPSVAGVAAIIRSYFPELTAAEVREVLMQTVYPYKKKVYKPGGITVETKKGTKIKNVKVRFSELSISGGIVNAQNAVEYLLEKQ